MIPMVTYALIAITVLLGWQAFGRPRLMERLLLWPPAVTRNHQYERLVTPVAGEFCLHEREKDVSG